MNLKIFLKEQTKKDELFDYAGVPSYLKTSKKSYKDKNKDKDDLWNKFIDIILIFCKYRIWHLCFLC